jgi:hypothetical protein
MLKAKRSGSALPVRTFVGRSGKTYVVLKTGRSYHVFMEVIARSAADDCGATGTASNTQRAWHEVWTKAGATR